MIAGQTSLEQYKLDINKCAIHLIIEHKAITVKVWYKNIRSVKLCCHID